MYVMEVLHPMSYFLGALEINNVDTTRTFLYTYTLIINISQEILCDTILVPYLANFA